MKNYVWSIISLFFFLFASPVALACSMSGDFVRPTNYELVELADAIVIATPAQQTSFLGLGDENEVSFVVESRIKGDPPELIKSVHDRLGVFVRKSDPNNIATAHPESFSGPCSRTTFKRGNPYVLFLTKQNDGSYSVGITAFSRDKEDYAGPNSIWMETIAYYLEVQKNGDRYAQLKELQNKYDDLMSAEQGPYDRKLADDIADQLSSTSPYKPSRFLIESFVALNLGQTLPFSVRHPDVNKEGGQADAITDFVMGAERDKFNVQSQKEYILRSLATEGHSELETKLFFESLFKEDNSVANLSHSLAYLGQNGYFDDALKLARSQIIPMIPTLKKEDVRPLYRGLYKMNLNEKDWKHPQWASHPDAMTWWPKFEYDLVNILNDKFDGDATVSKEVLKALRPTDYRDNPEIAKQLADLSGENDVIIWAEDEFWNLIENGENPQSYKFVLPIEIMLIDYYVPRPEKIDRIFCDSRTRPIFLSHLKNTHFKYPNYLSERLAVQFNLMSPDEQQLFRNALKTFSENEGGHFAYRENPELNNVYDEIASLVGKSKNIEPLLRNRYFQYHPVICE